MADSQGPPAGERLCREEKLRRRREFLRCYKEGRRRHGKYVVLYAVPNSEGHARLGVTVSRKVGRAVVRQRLRRRAREIYRRWPRRSELPALDLVVHYRPRAAGADFAALRCDLIGLLTSVIDRSERTTA